MAEIILETKALGPVRMTKAEWMARGKALFGEDFMRWRFVCPACCHVQAVEDFAPYKSQGATPNSATNECIGRYDGHMDVDMGAGQPCNYAGYGLFRLSPVLVIDEEKNTETASFAFDEDSTEPPQHQGAMDIEETVDIEREPWPGRKPEKPSVEPRTGSKPIGLSVEPMGMRKPGMKSVEPLAGRKPEKPSVEPGSQRKPEKLSVEPSAGRKPVSTSVRATNNEETGIREREPCPLRKTKGREREREGG